MENELAALQKNIKKLNTLILKLQTLIKSERSRRIAQSRRIDNLEARLSQLERKG